MKLNNLSTGNHLFSQAKRVAALLLLPFLVTLTLPQAQGQKLAIQRLNPPGSAYAFAFGLNNGGKVVGSFTDSVGAYHGFIYDGAKYKIVTFPKSASFTQTNGINDSNVVVGDYTTADGLNHGFFLRAGKLTSYDVTKGVSTRIYAINDAGTFVGSVGNDGANQGYLNRGGKVTVFTVNGNPTEDYGVNKSDVSVGSFLDPDLIHTHGFVRDASGKITQVDYPGGIGITVCLGINDLGVIGGYYVDTSNVAHGFTLTKGTFRRFWVPDVAGINNAGVFVGGYTTKANKNYGFLTTPR
jgi:probable HAF family extracellular repeat protein